MDQTTSEYVEDVTGETPTKMPPLEVHVVAPVRVEEYPARTIATQQLGVYGAAQQIATEAPQRASLLVRNTSANPVWIGTAGVTATTGYLLLANEHVELVTIAQVWAVATDALPAAVAILAQFRDG